MFEEALVYQVRDKIYESITNGHGYYKSIFSNEKYLELEQEDQDLIMGSLMTDFGLTTKDLIDHCIEETKQPRTFEEIVEETQSLIAKGIKQCEKIQKTIGEGE
ncbi:hypothetical protein [Peribacillus kribbensis]|uniref:hypothetical protein n=1 Tax=Peribacillus kribbensis TaxID=356658 RepID=UPI00040B2FA1|nr:hypothetical protein [Peribacillus kribbensis]